MKTTIFNKCSYCGGYEIEENNDENINITNPEISCIKITEKENFDIDVCVRCFKKVFDTILK